MASRRKSQRSGPLLDKRAVDAAREALELLDEGEVGEHIGVKGVSKYAATHRFRAEVEGYRGWEWNAVVAWAPGNEAVTINEVALVQGGEALKAPEWVPYHERVRPGDLGPKDVLPPRADDVRLADAKDAAVPALQAKSRLKLSEVGVQQAAERLAAGDFGPESSYAKHAQFRCGTCAFYLGLQGVLPFDAGVCVNEYSADGHLVDAQFGCGAHSDTPPAEPLSTNDGEAFDDERPERFQVR